VPTKRFSFLEFWTFLHLLGENKKNKKSTVLEESFFEVCVFLQLLSEIILCNFLQLQGKNS
jgi:hypothetical protein